MLKVLCGVTNFLLKIYKIVGSIRVSFIFSFNTKRILIINTVKKCVPGYIPEYENVLRQNPVLYKFFDSVGSILFVMDEFCFPLI